MPESKWWAVGWWIVCAAFAAFAIWAFNVLPVLPGP
jgi:hypothetical protein